LDGESSRIGAAFRPEVFFIGRTEGWGVARGPTGRIVRRCRILTDGELADAYRAIHFDETFQWDDGEADEWRWAMTRGLDGRYVAAEALAGAGIQGRYDGGDYLLSFRRPLRPDGGPRPRFVTRFTQISETVALKSVRIFMFGLPIGSLTAFHRRAD
jgi:hypothetical protein